MTPMFTPVQIEDLTKRFPEKFPEFQRLLAHRFDAQHPNPQTEMRLAQLSAEMSLSDYLKSSDVS